MYTLITAANSAVAYKLKSTLDSDTLLGDYLELPDLMLQLGKVIKLPNPQAISYTHQMLALCLDRDVQAIYPLRKEEQELLINSRQLFFEYNIQIVVIDDQI